MSIAERTVPPLRPGQRLTVQEFLRRWEAMPEVDGGKISRRCHRFGCRDLPHGAAYDLGVKKALYQTAGVREYVAVLEEEEEIRWHRLVKGTYELCRPNAQGIFRSKVFSRPVARWAGIWKYDMARVLQTLQRGLRSTEHPS